MSITIAITCITFITASILKQRPTLPSPSPSRLSHELQLRPYNNVHHFNHRRHHIYHMLYSFNPITMSITIAITFITCNTTSILKQCPSLPSRSPSRLSHEIKLQFYNNVHHHRHHLNHKHYSFNRLTMSITITITCITCITASIL